MSFLANIVKFHVFIALCATSVYYLRPGLFTETTNYLLSLQKSIGASSITDERLFTAADLAKFDSIENDEEIYLSILGSVYDVTKGKKHYGTGCTYGFFTGKDASAAFITGNFNEFTSQSDDVVQLEPSDIASLMNWKKFYDETYQFKGKLVGRFYDKQGAPTDYYRKVEALAQVAKDTKERESRQNELFPPCNIEWAVETGTRVWCTLESGGIRRHWVGVPRKYYEPGKTSFRCACVKPDDLNSPLLKTYEGCDTLSDQCFYSLD